MTKELSWKRPFFGDGKGITAQLVECGIIKPEDRDIVQKQIRNFYIVGILFGILCGAGFMYILFKSGVLIV